MRYALVGPAILLACVCLSVRAAEEDQPATVVPLDQLTEKLEQSLEARVDIELKTGKAYLRCKLLRVIPGEKGGPPKALKFQENDGARPVSIAFTAVRSLSVDREVVYQAAAPAKKTGKQTAADKAAAAEREKWMARAKAHNVPIWPELTADEHKAEEKKTHEQIDKLKQAYPNLSLYETHEFLFVSDMPREQVVPYAGSLDQMYDLMCQMYGIKAGASMFKGKCLIVAFLQEGDFLGSELALYKHNAQGAQGVCNCSSNGDVAMLCFRGNDPGYFGQVLVHETSHGFIHRYRTLQHLPSWVNEGMAEWIAQTLVNYDGGVKLKRARALQTMQQTHSLQGMLSEDPIQPIHYGMAAHVTDYLIRRDKRAYAQWINGMKEGKTWEESLRDAYGLTTQQLLGEFGAEIGVPDLRP